jgi:hypothetical protein
MELLIGQGCGFDSYIINKIFFLKFTLCFLLVFAQ